MAAIPSRSLLVVDETARIASLLDELHALRDQHPLWSSRLFALFQNGTLDRSDLKYIFSQYQLYSRSFTRFISAVMANCESDYFRARLSQNLWEEGGGCAPEKRHAELFRSFLRDALDVPAPEDTEFEVFTQHFTREYLTSCLGNDPIAGAAFLSLGTESIVPRMYTIFMTGLRAAGLRTDQLEFFQLHVECDDDHAETLEQMMISYASEPRWFDTCRRAMQRALDLRLEFFDRLAEALVHRRVASLLGRVNAERSLATGARPADLVHRASEVAPLLYTNQIAADDVAFTVTRINVPAEVLDPRRVVIPPGKANERHRHAHETFIYILEGTARIQIDAHAIEVSAGDSIVVPRWAMHQTRNTGAGELAFLAVTDYHLTKRGFLGDASAYRRDESANRHRQE
jgi:quercetin dioxygenase-like cupin family protein/pyrroloquinoline quinone (PQQ) biosynthesis protein C